MNDKMARRRSAIHAPVGPVTAPSMCITATRHAWHRQLTQETNTGQRKRFLSPSVTNVNVPTYGKTRCCSEQNPWTAVVQLPAFTYNDTSFSTISSIPHINSQESQMLKLGIQKIISGERIGRCLTSVDVSSQIIANVPL